jgi:hypothetical protein
LTTFESLQIRPALRAGKTLTPVGGEEWFRMSVPATDCPRIGKDFLEEERRVMGTASFDKNICARLRGDRSVGVWPGHGEAALDESVTPRKF